MRRGLFPSPACGDLDDCMVENCKGTIPSGGPRHGECCCRLFRRCRPGIRQGQPLQASVHGLNGEPLGPLRRHVLVLLLVHGGAGGYHVARPAAQGAGAWHARLADRRVHRHRPPDADDRHLLSELHAAEGPAPRARRLVQPRLLRPCLSPLHADPRHLRWPARVDRRPQAGQLVCRRAAQFDRCHLRSHLARKHDRHRPRRHRSAATLDGELSGRRRLLRRALADPVPAGDHGPHQHPQPHLQSEARCAASCQAKS